MVIISQMIDLRCHPWCLVGQNTKSCRPDRLLMIQYSSLLLMMVYKPNYLDQQLVCRLKDNNDVTGWKGTLSTHSSVVDYYTIPLTHNLLLYWERLGRVQSMPSKKDSMSSRPSVTNCQRWVRMGGLSLFPISWADFATLKWIEHKFILKSMSSGAIFLTPCRPCILCEVDHLLIYLKYFIFGYFE